MHSKVAQVSLDILSNISQLSIRHQFLNMINYNQSINIQINLGNKLLVENKKNININLDLM
jgi:hypothetical protein